MTTPVLSNTVRIAGECRTYRIAATVAPEKDSGGALLLRMGLFHLATTRMTPKNDTKFVTKAAATPATDMIVPASAGPTARTRLNSIPLSAEAAARSSLGTNSGRIARQAGVSNASPADAEYQGNPRRKSQCLKARKISAAISRRASTLETQPRARIDRLRCG
jgi:hypothetical protein